MTITIETIEAAEKLLGVAFTEAERALMLDNLSPQIEMAVRRRAFALPPDTAPASRFDPRLPGFVMPSAAASMPAPAPFVLPPREEDIAFAPVTALAGWISTRQLTSERLTRIYLDRIERLNPKLFCFATVTSEAALTRAAELDAMTARGINLGPLHGIPYGMKDIIDTARVETAWGAEPYQGRVPAQDAHIATALHEAGAVLLGKTTVGALAYGDLWYGGRTRNPWNLNEGSSGSSAGSAAATAAGLVGFAIGTETLGSIVSPSTRCGTVGLRPTFGRVSRRGAMALCWSLDKIGPICRAVEDTALVLGVINAPDGQDEWQIPAPFGGVAESFAGLRLGYYPADFEDAEANDLDRAALEVACGLGLEMVELTRPQRPYDSLMAILYAEAAAAFETLTLSGDDDKLTWQDADAWPNSFRKARFLSAVDHVQAERLRRVVMQDMDAAFQAADVIIGPSLAGPMLLITNYMGQPCLCLPSGHRLTATRDPISLSRNSLEPGEAIGPLYEIPHSISLWGGLFDEARLLAVGRALEALLGVSGRRPDMSDGRAGR
jgi:Asp-tRNA(Asn)/Glu-tRNA(Gln) amidotransferase A subunit family amidase